MSTVSHATEVPDVVHVDRNWYLRAYPDVAELGLDPVDHYVRYGRALGRSPLPRERALKRIVLIVADISTIGGISSRTRKTLAGADDRDIDYVAITARSERGGETPGALCYANDAERFMEEMDSWLPSDTVMVVSNNAIRAFPKRVRERIYRYPLVYIFAGQMAFMIQDSKILKDRAYVERLRAMRIISFSDADINFQRQLGIHGQVKGFVPVDQRERNTYDPRTNTRLGYIGRIDFHAKDTLRLLDIAAELRGSPWGPIRIFTTDGRNSPQYLEFRERMIADGLESEFEFILNCTDKEAMFGELAALLVPSRKEAFGNSVVEALSFGVPVIAPSYAPGPAEIVEHGRSGFLLDDYSGRRVAEVLSSLNEQDMATMSQHAFKRHKRYRIDAHLAQLESLCQEAVREFDGENVLPVFPSLKLLGDES